MHANNHWIIGKEIRCCHFDNRKLIRSAQLKSSQSTEWPLAFHFSWFGTNWTVEQSSRLSGNNVENKQLITFGRRQKNSLTENMWRKKFSFLLRFCVAAHFVYGYVCVFVPAIGRLLKWAKIRKVADEFSFAQSNVYCMRHKNHHLRGNCALLFSDFYTIRRYWRRRYTFL